MQATTILVVDDEEVVRDAYRHMFAGHPEFVVVAEATDGSEAVSRYAEHRPDVVLMDLKMPRMSGVEAMGEISRRFPDACMVAITTFATIDYIAPALRAGAAGYLVKDASVEQVEQGIRRALADEMPLSPQIARALARSVAEDTVPDSSASARSTSGGTLSRMRAQISSRLPRQMGAPTPREQQVLDQLAMGLGNREIAENLSISEAAVKAHLRHIGDKWDVRSRTQILVLAYRYGLVTAEEGLR